MQMISGGIGLDSVAFTKTAAMLYGNEVFGAVFGRASGGKRLRFSKAARVGDHWEFEFKIDHEGVPAYAKDNEYYWRRAFSGSFKRPTVLPMIGRTKIVMAQITGDTITVALPARYNPLAPRVRHPQVEDVRLPDALAEAALETTTEPKTPSHGCSELRLGQLVREVNARKAELGDALVLSVTPEGKLRALVEYG